MQHAVGHSPRAESPGASHCSGRCETPENSVIYYGPLQKRKKKRVGFKKAKGQGTEL